MNPKPLSITFQALALAFMWVGAIPVEAQGQPAQVPELPAANTGTAFTYQGQLHNNNNPANGSFDFQFKLFDAAAGGTQIGTTQGANAVAVSQGVFTTALDFGAVFDGQARWLEIGVRPAGGGGYTLLAPRQALTATPYALSLVPGAVMSGGVAGSMLRAVNTHFAQTAIRGEADTGIGILGQSFQNLGVYGVTDVGEAVRGDSFSSGTAVRGLSGSGTGVRGQSTSGTGVHGESGSEAGVHGESTSYAGVLGQSEGFIGVFGIATAATGPVRGVVGQSNSTSGTGVFGAVGSATGVTYGVEGWTYSPSGTGVAGVAVASGGGAKGVLGKSDSDDGIGVHGVATGTSGSAWGVWGQSASSNGGTGVRGTGSGHGVWGSSGSSSGIGVYGQHFSPNAIAVKGVAGSSGAVGVWGESAANTGVYGISGNANGRGVWGENTGGGWAGYFNGHVQVNGTLSKTAGGFQVDHPLDPANQYLNHSFVESPDMKNLYDGVVVLDANGAAQVTLPDWFEALNGGEEFQDDFRYQLTPIGAAMPNLHIAEEIEGSTFRIAGGVPGMKVSWLLTGIRHDPYAEAHRIAVEQVKPADQLGTYLHPELYGQPARLALGHGQVPRHGEQQLEEFASNR